MSGRDVFDALLRTWYRGKPPVCPPLERYARPSMATFAALRRAGRPVLLDGLLDDWPRRADLTLARLRERFADRRLPTMLTSGGRVEGDIDRGLALGTARFGDYLDRLTNGDAVDSYLVSPLDHWLPELKDDMPPPIYCRDAPWRNARLWLSAPGTRVPLHHDVAHNVFIQLVGRKRLFLYPSAASPWLYSNPFSSGLPNYSRTDPERPDYDTFPLSRAVRPIEVVLGPGDAIFMPSRWWHLVRSLDVSLSVNFWFADGAVALAVRAAEIVKRIRGLEIYGLEQRLHSPADRSARAASSVEA